MGFTWIRLVTVYSTRKVVLLHPLLLRFLILRPWGLPPFGLQKLGLSLDYGRAWRLSQIDHCTHLLQLKPLRNNHTILSQIHLVKSSLVLVLPLKHSVTLTPSGYAVQLNEEGREITPTRGDPVLATCSSWPGWRTLGGTPTPDQLVVCLRWLRHQPVGQKHCAV